MASDFRMIPMGLKVLILLGILLGPAGSQTRRDVHHVDPHDASSLRPCRGIPDGDRTDAFSVICESPLNLFGWLTDTEDNPTEEDLASAALPLDPDRFVRRAWDRFVSDRESPLLSQLANRRVPLRC
jgi:hypothetical protein